MSQRGSQLWEAELEGVSVQCQGFGELLVHVATWQVMGLRLQDSTWPPGRSWVSDCRTGRHLKQSHLHHHNHLQCEDKIQDDAIKKERPYRIFFKDLFLFKENEMAAKKKEKLMSRSMKIYQKTTFSSRMKSRSHLGQLTFYSEAHGGSDENLGLDPTLILRLTEGADRKRTLHEFINDQRDRFLLE
ncbi:hypothetical protein STEG23_006006, partial [Scotinomys teguina]